jgi:outer membrane protein assembly factor BamB
VYYLHKGYKTELKLKSAMTRLRSALVAAALVITVIVINGGFLTSGGSLGISAPSAGNGHLGSGGQTLSSANPTLRGASSIAGMRAGPAIVGNATAPCNNLSGSCSVTLSFSQPVSLLLLYLSLSIGNMTGCNLSIPNATQLSISDTDSLVWHPRPPGSVNVRSSCLLIKHTYVDVLYGFYSIAPVPQQYSDHITVKYPHEPEIMNGTVVALGIVGEDPNNPYLMPSAWNISQSSSSSISYPYDLDVPIAGALVIGMGVSSILATSTTLTASWNNLTDVLVASGTSGSNPYSYGLAIGDRVVQTPGPVTFSYSRAYSGGEPFDARAVEVIAPVTPAAPTSTWTQYQGNATHNGYSASVGPAAPFVAWSQSVGRGPVIGLASASGDIVDSLVSQGGPYQVWNGTSGMFELNLTVQGPGIVPVTHSATGYPAVAGGNVVGEYYAPCQLDAVPLTGGNVSWAAAVGACSPISVGESNAQGVGYSGIAISGNTVIYDLMGTDTVWAFDLSNGSSLWNTSVGGPLEEIPAIGSGLVLVGSNLTDNVTALSLSNGQVVWKVNLSSPLAATPAYVSGLFLVPTKNGELTALAADNGTVEWAVANLGGMGTTPTVYGSTVIEPTSSGTIWALSLGTGQILWERSGNPGFVAPAAIGADGTIYIANSSGVLWALNGSTGTLDWNYSLSGNVTASPVLEGTWLYVVTDSGTIYAFTSTPRTTTPTEDGFAQGNQGTGTNITVSGFTTSGGNNVVLILYSMILYTTAPVSAPSPTLVTPSDSAHLSWAWRTGGIVNASVRDPTVGAVQIVSYEFWAASVAPLTRDQVSVAFDGHFQAAVRLANALLSVIGIAGANMTDPFLGVPQPSNATRTVLNGTSSSTTIATAIDPALKDDLLVGYLVTSNVAPGSYASIPQEGWYPGNTPAGAIAQGSPYSSETTGSLATGPHATGPGWVGANVSALVANFTMELLVDAVAPAGPAVTMTGGFTFDLGSPVIQYAEVSGGVGPYTFQWTWSPVGDIGGVSCSSPSPASYVCTVGYIGGSSHYLIIGVRVTDGNWQTAYTSRLVSVNGNLEGPSLSALGVPAPGNVYLDSNATGVPVVLNVSWSDGSGPYTVDFFASNGTLLHSIVSNPPVNWTIDAPQGYSGYYVTVQDGATVPQIVTSGMLGITVNQPFQLTNFTLMGSANETLGNPVSFNVTWSGGAGPYTLWLYEGNSTNCLADRDLVQGPSLYAYGEHTLPAVIPPLGRDYYCVVAEDGATHPQTSTIGPISVSVSSPTTSPSPTPVSSSSSKIPGSVLAALYGLVALVVVLAIVVAFLWRRQRGGGSQTPPSTSAPDAGTMSGPPGKGKDWEEGEDTSKGSVSPGPGQPSSPPR